VLPSSQAASVCGEPFGAGPQMRLSPSRESIGVEPFSQPGSDSSSQEKKPSLSRTGTLRSSQTAGVLIVATGTFGLLFAPAFFFAALFVFAALFGLDACLA